MHPLVGLAERHERGLIAHGSDGIAVVPLAEATALMSVWPQVGRVGRQPNDEHAYQVVVPLIVVVDRLIQLRDRAQQLPARQRRQRHPGWLRHNGDP